MKRNTGTADLASLAAIQASNEIYNSFCMIFDDIDNNSSRQVIQWIIESNYAPPDQRPDILNLLINSPGGSLVDGFAIIDVMNSSTIPIRTIGVGEIASAGLMIFMNGTPGQRILTPNTSIMSHRFSAGARPQKEHELFAVAKEYNLASDRILKHYKKCTKLKESDIRKYLLPPEDVYLTAQEALKLKLCDKVALIDD